MLRNFSGQEETGAGVRWAEILTATRNCLTFIGAASLAGWFSTKPGAWPLAAALATLVLVWWACYRLAVAVSCRPSRTLADRRVPVPPTRYARIRKPGKRAVASWRQVVEDLRFEKEAQRAGW